MSPLNHQGALELPAPPGHSHKLAVLKESPMRLSRLLLYVASLITLVSAIPAAHADNIAWTDWTRVAAGSPGTGTGTISTAKYGSVGVTYSGQTSGLLTNYPSWGPSTTF